MDGKIEQKIIVRRSDKGKRIKKREKEKESNNRERGK